ncbi:MAG: MFS transporter, partial [Planctomycetaceae bacterium]
PYELLALRFFSGMGVGGMWPTGVALASEAWSDVSRPLLSGLLGTAANVGIVCMGVWAYLVPISHETWRTALFWTGSPLLLGLLVLARVPESPSWLQARLTQARGGAPPRILRDLLRPPLLRMTLLGICLGAIPLLGGWGVTAWLIPWSDQVLGAGDPRAKALTSILRAGGGSIGSLLGGWIANLLGRRVTYFLISLVTLLISEFIYFQLAPGQPLFSPMVFVVGGISTIFFGWLPLYLPELFPSHARAAGSGISFNSGRILTALGVLATGAITAAFGGDYAAAGRVTSLIYALGMVVILFAPDTSGRTLGQPTQPAASPADSPRPVS